MDMKTLTGPLIKKIREALEMTPTEFASRLGVSAAAVARWETGSRKPRLDSMRKLRTMGRKAGVA